MTWHPIGPDFVYAPRNTPAGRLSRRNENGRQGLVSSITVDPTDVQTIYVAERPSSGGSTAFRSRTDGRSWDPIADELQGADPSVDPTCIAVNPDHPATLYLGTGGRQGVYVSSGRGDPGTWGPRRAIPGYVRKLLVDPRFSATLATTVLYAATNNGVYRSPDGGTTWVQVLAGDAWSLVATYPPASTAAHFYAGINGQGVFHTTDPTTAWTNLNAAGIGLPAHTAPTAAEPEGNFNVVLVDLVGAHPDRVYAWFMKQSCAPACSQVSAMLWTSSASTTSWTQIPAATLPPPQYGFYCLSFAVAPNSPGDGLTDVLVFGNVGLQRSIDAGRTWQPDPVWFHADQHAIAFAPEIPPAGTIPTTFIGCDGGIAKSGGFADRSIALTAPAHFNEGFPLLDSYAWQNLDHGKQSSAIYQYAGGESDTVISYVGCQDTGLQAGAGSLGWRGIADADGGPIACAAAPGGVAVWGLLGAFGAWPSFRIWTWTDRGEFAPAVAQATLAGSLLQGTSNHVVTTDGQCLVGAIVRDSDTTLSIALTAGAAAQAATPASMTKIIVGSSILVDDGTPTSESVTVTAVSATTFTAVFARSHAAGASLKPNRVVVARIDASGAATQVSQDLTPQGSVTSLGKPHNANEYYCVTGNGKLWRTPGGSLPGPGTIWAEVATGRPAGASIASIAQMSSGPVYVLLRSPRTVGPTTTPLFEVQSGSWVAAPCTGLPAGASFGKLVADPLGGAQLFATAGSRLYELTSPSLTGGTWTWADRSENLPGSPIYDLWTGVADPTGEKRVLLRAALPTRGVWEREVRATPEPATWLYMRDNIMDSGILANSPDGAINPYAPPGRVWHYQSPDILIDARQQRPVAGGTDFFQTDPEGNPVPPLNHVLFDELVDNSGAIPAGDSARAHVIVRNRSESPASATVWAIYARVSAGVPSLAASPSLGNAFPFWNQFGAGGTITPALPADSPWTSAGPPQVLTGIDAAHPQVATFSFVAPTPPAGDAGHYCMAAFIHSAAAPIGETRMSVDAIAPTNRQVAQKNLHIGPPLPPAPGPAAGDDATGAPLMEHYVEFHNPETKGRLANIRLDTEMLPPGIRVRMRPSRVTTTLPLPQAGAGMERTFESPVPRRWLAPEQRGLVWWLVALLSRLWCRIVNFVRGLLGMPKQPCKVQWTVPALSNTVFEAMSPGIAEIRGIALPPGGMGALLIAVEPLVPLQPGAEYRFEVQQWARPADGQEVPDYPGRGPETGGMAMVGGGTHVIHIAGEGKRHENVVAPSHRQDIDPEERERIEREAEREKVVPPWAKEHVEQREHEQGRRA
jgi:hypothetical protein